jgi:hypothetical protein
MRSGVASVAPPSRGAGPASPSQILRRGERRAQRLRDRQMRAYVLRLA